MAASRAGANAETSTRSNGGTPPYGPAQSESSMSTPGSRGGAGAAGPEVAGVVLAHDAAVIMVMRTALDAMNRCDMVPHLLRPAWRARCGAPAHGRLHRVGSSVRHGRARPGPQGEPRSRPSTQERVPAISEACPHGRA